MSEFIEEAERQPITPNGGLGNRIFSTAASVLVAGAILEVPPAIAHHINGVEVSPGLISFAAALGGAVLTSLAIQRSFKQ